MRIIFVGNERSAAIEALQPVLEQGASKCFF